MIISFLPWIQLAHEGLSVNSMDIHPNGQILATGGEDHKVYLWDLGKIRMALETRVQDAPADSGRVESLATELDTVPLLSVLQRSNEAVNAVRWRPDGRQLAVGGLDMSVHVWQPMPGAGLEGPWKVQYTVKAHTADIVDLAWSRSGLHLASTSVDNRVTLLDARARKYEILVGHENYVLGAAFDPSEEYLATQANDGTVRLWRPVAGSLRWDSVHELQAMTVAHGTRTPFLRLAWSPDGAFLAVPSFDGDSHGVKVFRRGHWAKEFIQLRAHRPVTCVRFAPCMYRKPGATDSFPLLAVGGKDGRVTFWTLQGPVFVPSTLFACAVTDLTWGTSGTELLACDTSGSVVYIRLSPEQLDGAVPAILTGAPAAIRVTESEGDSLGIHEMLPPVPSSPGQSHNTHPSSQVQSPTTTLIPSQSNSSPLPKNQSRRITPKRVNSSSISSISLTPSTIVDSTNSLNVSNQVEVEVEKDKNIVEDEEFMEEEKEELPKKKKLVEGEGEKLVEEEEELVEEEEEILSQQNSNNRMKRSSRRDNSNSHSHSHSPSNSSSTINIPNIPSIIPPVVTTSTNSNKKRRPTTSNSNSTLTSTSNSTSTTTTTSTSTLSNSNLIVSNSTIMNGVGVMNGSIGTTNERGNFVFQSTQHENILFGEEDTVGTRFVTEARFGDEGAIGSSVRSQSLEVQVADPEDSDATSLVSSRDGAGRIVWQDLLADRVTAVVCSLRFSAVGCASGALFIYSPAGRRLQSRLQLPRHVHTLATEVSGRYLAAVDRGGELRVWDIQTMRAVHEAVALPTCAGRLLQIVLGGDGVAAAVFHGGSAFVLHADMRVWMRLRAYDAALEGASSSTAVWGSGPLASLDKSLAGEGATVTGSDSLLLTAGSYERALATAAYLEERVAAAKLLHSAIEYRDSLLQLVRFLAQVPHVARLREIAEEILGGSSFNTKEEFILGIPRTTLLVKVLDIIRRVPSLAKLAAEIQLSIQKDK